jgi:hypothetical protein
MNRIHQPLVYADDVDLLGGSRNTLKKNTEALTDTNKELCLQVNTMKTRLHLFLITRIHGKIIT